MYRDGYSAIYNHYTVIGSTIHVQFQNTASSPFIVGINIDDDSSWTTSVDGACELNHSESTLLGPLSSSKCNADFTRSWGSVEVLSTDPYLDGSNKTAVGSDPNEISVYNLFAATIDATTNGVYWNVYIEYHVLFSELQTEPIS